MRNLELLAPAKDLETGIVAINNGADAVYMGAPAFGARKAASNSLEDIATLVDYAHSFYCKVFITLNTIIYDDEFPEVERLINELHRIGVDALIIQDMGILTLPLPPIAIHASTQTHNYDPERIKFLDRTGVQRIVLARELSLEQIRQIRREVEAELEVFIHGALCVSLSGQCYLSQYITGRSANRGECAQPCRMKWSVRDSDQNIWIKDKYVLSLKDLNLSAYIGELVDAGVDSFKIEGRLKDPNYVANIVSYYHSLLNNKEEISNGIKRSGSGIVIPGFESDPERSFSRGFSEYFINGRKKGAVNFDTPKSMGKKIGVTVKSSGNKLWISPEMEIHNGDGICYLAAGELRGIRVNKVEGDCLHCHEKNDIKPGTVLYRNYDHDFNQLLNRRKSVRKIRIQIKLISTDGLLEMIAVDEDGVEARIKSIEKFDQAKNPHQKERILEQVGKCGTTIFLCTETAYEGDILFIPSQRLNELRYELLEKLKANREVNRPLLPVGEIKKNIPYTLAADWKCNVVNKKAALFYQARGVDKVEMGFEIHPPENKELMRSRYCLLYELGKCRKTTQLPDHIFPLYLYNDRHTLRLEFDCKACMMSIYAER